MKILRLGGLDCRLVGDLSSAKMVVVLLHGFGAPGTDLVPLAHVLSVPPDTAFVFPAAPLTMPAFFGGDSRAWWMIDMARLEADLAAGRPRDRSDETPEGISKPRTMVMTMLDDLAAEHGVTSDRIVLGGFSQGSMIACDVALRSERPLAGLIVWSGTLLSAADWRAGMSRRAGLRVVQSHGETDPLLPFFLAEKLRDELRDNGIIVKWTAFAGGHEIPPAVIDSTNEVLHTIYGGLEPR
jgi:phospholipase/carboxylesterase